jgi:N-acyl-D-aspartate/D-glutamate deacylase
LKSGTLIGGRLKKTTGRGMFMHKVFSTSTMLAILLFGGGLSVLTAGCSSTENYDILIKGGTVYDGTKSEPRVTDIGIRGDRIVAIGNLTGIATKTINAAGYAVTPGFIDVHTHADLSFVFAGEKASLASTVPEWKENHNWLHQGVTTVVTGNCGSGFADTGKWFGILDRLGFGTNVYHLAAYGAIREELFGKDLTQALTKAQIDAMKDRLAEEMKKGAIGLSVGLEYSPDYLATTEELIELAKVVKSHGGIYVSHIRDQTGTIYPGGKVGVLEAIKEAIEIGRQAAVPVHISHIQENAPHSVNASQMIELIELARKEGIDVTTDQHPYDVGLSPMTYRLPKKYVVSNQIRDEFKTPEGRKELKKAVEQVFNILSPDKIVIGSLTSKELDGKSIKEIADTQGKEPSTCFVDIATADGPPTFAYFYEISDQINIDIMPHDYVFTGSDAFLDLGFFKAHPRFYGTFPRKIRNYALDGKIMTLNAAIMSMTSLPAQKFKMKDRGNIRVGNFADIVVIDLKTIRELGTYENPAQYPEGIIHVLVNGVVSIENGKSTGQTGGRPQRKE